MSEEIKNNTTEPTEEEKAAVLKKADFFARQGISSRKGECIILSHGARFICNLETKEVRKMEEKKHGRV